MHTDPSTLDLADRYKLMIGAIVPRPIAFVSTISTGGSHNLAPYSFFNGISSSPMLLQFCPANNIDGTEKDSLRNASHAPRGVGEFVINIASERYADEVAAAGAALAHGESEFEHTGLTPAESSVVSPPRVAESPLAFECRTREIMRFAPGEPAGGNLVIGEVVSIFTQEGVLNGRTHVDPDALEAIGRMGGKLYTKTSDRFEIVPGRNAIADR